MKVSDFDRVTCITVDTRFPAWPLRARREVEAKGADCELFLNGSARVGEIGASHYSQINGPVPEGFIGRSGAHHLARAFVEVVRRADHDGIDRLLIVEDDVEFTADYDRVTDAVCVPDDWGLYYFGANHTWATTEEVNKHLLRLHGSYTTHCIGIHRRAFAAILALDLDKPIDVLLGGVHEFTPSYAAWPSVAVQRPGPSTIDGGAHADYAGWFASKGSNWPVAVAEVAGDSAGKVAGDSGRRWNVTNPTSAQQAARLAVLRNECPHGTRTEGCGCSGLLRCSLGKGKDGLASVQDCYTCLRERFEVG